MPSQLRSPGRMRGSTGTAAAYAWQHRDRRGDEAVNRGLFDAVLAHTPAGEVREGIEHAATFVFDMSAEPTVRLLDYGISVVPFDVSIESVVRQLGNGSQVSCQDTVPFCVWVASQHLHNYQAAIVHTIRVCGDIDTNCAIVGGIVALAVGAEGIPSAWRKDREALDCATERGA